jgi:hypothetical protein
MHVTAVNRILPINKFSVCVDFNFPADDRFDVVEAQWRTTNEHVTYSLRTLYLVCHVTIATESFEFIVDDLKTKSHCVTIRQISISSV